MKAYRELFEVVVFVLLLRSRLFFTTKMAVQPYTQVPHRLGTGNNIEWRRKCPSLIKVAHPQLGAGKLPLNISVILNEERVLVLRVVCVNLN